MEKETQKSLKTGRNFLASFLVLAVVSLVAFGITNVKDKESVSADNPTFFFSSSSSCSSSAVSLMKPAGNTTVYLCVDGDNEGTGLLGAEVHVNYTSDSINNLSATCSAFDTCINLSEEGTIKLLAASGPSEEGGMPVSNQKLFASVNMDLIAEDASFTFTTAQIINSSQAVETRSGTGLAISVGVPPECNDGDIDVGEDCDTTQLGGETCITRGYDGGELVCTASCTFDESGCLMGAAPTCGDGTCDPNEDNTTCPADCSADPVVAGCGNGGLDAGEQCDTALATSSWLYTSCSNAGFTDAQTGSDIACSGTCLLDYTNCEGNPPDVTCGNGVPQVGEECDDGNLTNGDGCSAACELEAGVIIPPVVVPPVVVPITGSALTSLQTQTAYGATSVTPGASTAVFAFAYFADGTSSTVTSCFECPTYASDTRDGLVTYHVSGPAIFSGSFLVATAGASVGDSISFYATYRDDNSGITKTSNTVVLPVVAVTPVVPPVTPPPAPVPTPVPVPTPTPTPVVRPAAPLTQATTTDAADTVIEEEESLVEVGLDVTSDPSATPEADRCVTDYANDVDSDSDGLSDRTECYLLTNPYNSDTDGDGCWDGDEINQFSTNPLIDDCSIEEKVEENVVIRDPQPGWVLPSVRVSGIAPRNSASVSAVVYPAEYKKLVAINTALETLIANKDDDAASNLEAKIDDLESLMAAYPEYSYSNLTGPIASLRVKAEDIKATVDLTHTPANEKEEKVDSYNFADSVAYISANLMEGSTYLGATSDLSDAAVGGQLAKSFHLYPDVTLTDLKPYDVVAIAAVPGGTKSSAAIRFSINSELSVGKPNPRSIGGQGIATGSISMGNIFINGVLAEDGQEIEIEIDEEKPTISGDSEYGAQVFAVWESIVLASSVISDSEEGAFDIQAPRNLETNTGHKVTLYAVKADEEGGKMRSEDVNVYFRIKDNVFPLGLFLWVLGITAALALLIFGLRKRLKKEGEAEFAEELTEAEKAYEDTEIPEVVVIPEEEVAVTEEQPMDAIEEIVEEAVEQPVIKEVIEKPIAPIAQTPSNPVEQDSPSNEDHNAKEEEVMNAFGEAVTTDAKPVDVNEAQHDLEEAKKELEEAKAKLAADKK